MRFYAGAGSTRPDGFGLERMLTGILARTYGFGDRGAIREGPAADLIVFDPKTIGPMLTTVVDDFQAGATRLKQGGTGISHIIVNGEPLLQSGGHTGAFPGRLSEVR
jgi:N-acyl-D-amino-acid deacylase